MKRNIAGSVIFWEYLEVLIVPNHQKMHNVYLAVAGYNFTKKALQFDLCHNLKNTKSYSLQRIFLWSKFNITIKHWLHSWELTHSHHVEAWTIIKKKLKYKIHRNNNMFWSILHQLTIFSWCISLICEIINFLNCYGPFILGNLQ